MMVLDCANHIMSQLAPWRKDREEISMDATLSYMTKIKNGIKEGCGRHGKECKLVEFQPRSLSTTLRYDIVAILYSEKLKATDEEISLDEYMESLKEKENKNYEV